MTLNGQECAGRMETGALVPQAPPAQLGQVSCLFGGVVVDIFAECAAGFYGMRHSG